jgi:hypothetical protein
MPCDSSQGMGDAYREDPQARREIQAMKAELDKVTSMLCSLLRALDDTTSIPPDVSEWFHQHRKYDRSKGR